MISLIFARRRDAVGQRQHRRPVGRAPLGHRPAIGRLPVGRRRLLLAGRFGRRPSSGGRMPRQLRLLPPAGPAAGRQLRPVAPFRSFRSLQWWTPFDRIKTFASDEGLDFESTLKPDIPVSPP